MRKLDCSVCLSVATLVLLGHLSLAQDAPSKPKSSDSPIVIRDRVGLTLQGAELALEAAKTKAAELKINENIAIVDDGGHLIAFVRMDKARPASISTAITKAVAAATTRVPTGPVRRGDAEPDFLLNLSLQNASSVSGGKMTALLGGIPIVVDSQVIGAIGVGGGTGEQDAEVAKAGMQRILDELR